MSAVISSAGPQNAVDYDPFAEGALARVVPSTEPQREIWLADQLGQDASLAFNESVSMRLKGRLDEGALRTALQSLLDRHSALRANLGPDGDTLCVLEQVPLELRTFDYSAMPADERESTVRERLRLAVETPFALQHDRLFRAELLRLDTDEHLLILTAHHIVCDGWSWWVLTRELAALYAQAVGAPHPPLPEADDYAEYALAEASRSADAADEAYWLQRFDGARFEGGVPVLDLPVDRPRPPRRSFASAREDYVLDADLVAAIRKMGARRGVSLFATLLASFAALLARLSNQSQVTVGIPAAGQSVDGHDHLVGHCVNTLPLLFDLDLAQPASKAIDDAQATLLDALEHQRYTFGTLLKKLKIGRDPSRLPLISVMFNIDQALDHEHAAFPGLEMDFASNARTFENFELFVNAVQENGALRMECQYNTDLFDTTTIRHWMGYWRTMLEAMVADDGAGGSAALGSLPLLAETERRLLLEKFNDTQVDYPRDRCVHELFEAQVAKRPDAVAVAFEGATLTFAELNARANRLAHHLRSLGVRPDDRVAVCADRSLEMVVALMATLKAGGAYVPLDPNYPHDRLAYMLGDCKPSVLLTQQALVGLLSGLAHSAQAVVLDAPTPAWSALSDANPERIATESGARHLAYVIYTSGSTGNPKGAMNEHRGVVNRLLWMQDEYRLDAEDAVLQKTPFSFDVSVWEFFLPLLSGARLVMARPDGHKDPAYLAAAVREHGITTMHFVPSMLHAFLEHGDTAACAGLKRVICSGEALPATLAADFHRKLPRVNLHNLYGPTEAAVDVTAWDCVPGDDRASVPIGRPIANTRMYVLDAFGQPVPMGVAGELFIGGVQVGRGYLDRPELTAERFVPDPFVREAEARMYKTGDLGRWRADGNIEYLGRNDFQVKVRGFRIELGEIEKNLAAHPSVSQTLVIARQDRPGDVRLVAYVVPRTGQGVDADALSAHLKRMLPEHMVPQHFVAMDAIPLSPNGKVERKALPAPDLSSQFATDRVVPRNDTERAIADAMAQVLGVPDIGVHDDFFALGGHSLLAAQLTTRLNRDLDATLSLRSVFDRPTVARLAEAIDDGRGKPAAKRTPIARRADQRRAPLSLVQERLRLLEEFNPGILSYNTPSGHRLTGPLDVALLDRAFRALAQRQSVLRTTIAIENGEPVQVVHDDVDPGLLRVQDLTSLPAGEREAEAGRRMQAMVETPFADLSRAPLFSARLFKIDDDVHILFFMPHHIIWDGWSFDLLYSDIAEIYAALGEGRAPNLPELPVSYGDYAAWHREWIQGPEYAAQLAFWRERLGKPNASGERPQAMPTDKPRRRGMSGSSKSRQLTLAQDTLESLHAQSRRIDVTVFVTLLTAYFAVLARMAGQRDMVIGTPVRGRNSSEVEGLMGYFTNLLPLRVELDPSMSFAETARRVREVVLDSFAHPDIRLEDLSRELNLKGEGGGMLYQALFSFQDIRQRVTRWGPLAHERVEVFQPGATEDLGLWFVEGAGGLTGGLIYNAEILHDETAVLLGQRYLATLQAIARDPTQSIETLTRFDDGEPVMIGQIEAKTVVAATDTDATSEAATVEVSTTAPAAVETHADPRVAYLVKLWRGLLDMPVEPGDNFFDLGGNSMLAVQMADRIFKDTGVRIKLMRFAVQSLQEVADELPATIGGGAGDSGVGARLVGGMKRLLGLKGAQ